MHADEQRRDMLLDDALQLCIAYVGERGIVALQKAKPPVIILKLHGLAHIRRQLVDKAENAFIMACLGTVHQRALKDKAKIFIVLLFNLRRQLLPSRGNKLHL